MKRPSTRTTAIAATAITGAVLLGAVVPAIAQNGDDTTTQSEFDRGARTAEHRAAFAEALADELGLETDDVEAALERVQERFRAQREAEMRSRLEERLAAAVEAGDLTQEQADATLEAHDAGVLGGRGLGRGPGVHHFGAGPGRMSARMEVWSAAG